MKETKKENQPTFEKLQGIEKRRREILLRGQLPFWKILSFWSSTCLKEVSTDALVWFTLALYVGIRGVAHALDEAPEEVAYFETSNLRILGGFLSFSLVVFADQAHARLRVM